MRGQQLDLRLAHPRQVDVDGRMGVYQPSYSFEKIEIQYIGKATQQFDGTWRCLANVLGNLCLVEVKITEGAHGGR